MNISPLDTPAPHGVGKLLVGGPVSNMCQLENNVNTTFRKNYLFNLTLGLNWGSLRLYSLAEQTSILNFALLALGFS